MGKGDKKRIWLIAALAVVLAASIYAWTSRTPAAHQGNPAADRDAVETEERSDTVAKYSAPTQSEIAEAREAGKIPVTIETARGTIKLELRGDLMPLTVANFTKLARAGFYDGLTFHRVEDWVIQGGDPLGNGMGGPGYTIKLETHPQMLNVRGAVAMARSTNPDSAGSQFYILRTDADWLDGQYAVFGHVTGGMDVVDKMAQGDKITSVTVGL